MANQKQQLEEIVASPFSSDAEKQAAQKLLDAMNTPQPSAPALAPVPAPAASVRGAKGSLWWVPEPTPEERIAFAKLHDDFRADIDARLAKEKAKAAAANSVASVTPQDANKTRLLATISDPASSEKQIIEAKLELVTLEIEEFNESRVRRMMGDTNAS